MKRYVPEVTGERPELTLIHTVTMKKGNIELICAKNQKKSDQRDSWQGQCEGEPITNCEFQQPKPKSDGARRCGCIIYFSTPSIVSNGLPKSGNVAYVATVPPSSNQHRRGPGP